MTGFKKTFYGAWTEGQQLFARALLPLSNNNETFSELIMWLGTATDKENLRHFFQELLDGSAASVGPIVLESPLLLALTRSVPWTEIAVGALLLVFPKNLFIRCSSVILLFAIQLLAHEWMFGLLFFVLILSFFETSERRIGHFLTIGLGIIYALSF